MATFDEVGSIIRRQFGARSGLLNDESEFLHELDSDLPSAGHQKTREDRQRRTSDEHAEAHDRGTFRAPLLIKSDSSDSENSDDDLRGEHLPLAAHLRRNLKGKKPEGAGN